LEKLLIIFISIALFLLLLWLIYQYFISNSKKSLLFQNGICPFCGAKNSKEQTVISAKILHSHGCSGISDVQFRCIECGEKLVVKISNSNPSCS